MSLDLQSFNSRSFDRGAGVWKEGLWVIIKLLFFQSPLPWPSSLRASLLRLFGATVGKGLVIRSGTNITFPWRLTVGDDVWIGEEVFILSLAPVVVESNVCISQRAFLCTGSHDYRRPDFALITKPIVIRAGSWVAAQAFVGPGVEIGPGSVVAASSVVTKCVPPKSLVKGNPASISEIDSESRADDR